MVQAGDLRHVQRRPAITDKTTSAWFGRVRNARTIDRQA